MKLRYEPHLDDLRRLVAGLKLAPGESTWPPARPE